MRKKFSRLFLISIFTFNFYGCGEKTIDTSPINTKRKTFIDSTKSTNFKPSILVEIDDLNVTFEVTISPKTNKEYKDTLVIAYIDDPIMDFISTPTYNTFGNFGTPTTLDKTNSIEYSSKGITSSRSTSFIGGTDINKIVSELEKGLNVAISWKDGEEFLHVEYVEIIIK